jgi:hypothetical protein
MNTTVFLHRPVRKTHSTAEQKYTKFFTTEVRDTLPLSFFLKATVA